MSNVLYRRPEQTSKNDENHNLPTVTCQHIAKLATGSRSRSDPILPFRGTIIMKLT